MVKYDLILYAKGGDMYEQVYNYILDYVYKYHINTDFVPIWFGIDFLEQKLSQPSRVCVYKYFEDCFIDDFYEGQEKIKLCFIEDENDVDTLLVEKYQSI